MPNLTQLTGSGSDATLITYVTSSPQVEPLDGPTSVDAVMDRFPEEVYAQGHDTHLYRFLAALCGDAGAGLLKKQAYIARLMFEAEFLNFQVLDDIYTSNFQFRRLKSETYTDDPNAALTPTQWDAMLAADQSYKNRITDFFRAMRLGTSPDGVRLAAEAGSGLDVEVIPHYRYIYDQYSDDPLGLTPYGVTTSTAEYTLVFRALNDSNSTYARTFHPVTTFTKPTLATGARPVPAPTGGNVFSAARTWATETVEHLLPEIERNTVEVLDRIGPANALATFLLDEDRFVEVETNGSPFASSERIHVNRFVQGSSSVAWPEVDPLQGYFIEAGVENEAGYYFGGAREFPTVFHTLEGARAYTEAALLDDSYDTAAFFSATGLAPFEQYRSEHVGAFGPMLSAIYTFLGSVPTDTIFAAANAVANQDTQLILEGAAA